MNVVGHGIDLVEVLEFERQLREPSFDLANRCFTTHELETAGDSPQRAERLAVRFAAKEAVLKALGTGWVTGISWKDVEVVSAPNGAPSIRVYGTVARRASEMGCSQFLISLSHTDVHAIASVIALGPTRSG